MSQVQIAGPTKRMQGHESGYQGVGERPAWRVPQRIKEYTGGIPRPMFWVRESLLRHRDDLEQLLRQEYNRQQQLVGCPGVSKAVPPNLKKVIDALEDALAEVEAAITAQQRQHASLAEAVRRVQTVPGIGKRNSLWLAVVLYRGQTLTGGTGTAKGLRAFLGLDPTRHESGTSVRGPRSISRMGGPGASAVVPGCPGRGAGQESPAYLLPAPGRCA